MKPLIPQTITAVSIVALALAVSGCGGGSSKKMAEVVEPMEPEPIMCPDGQEPNAANDACVDTAETTAMKKAEAAAATKAAGTKATQIATEAEQTTDAGLGGSADNGSAVTTYSLTIDNDGSKIMIADTALAGDDDPKFTQAADLGHSRTMHTRMMKADDDGNVMTEVVIVRHDRDAPTLVEFEKFESPDGMTPQELDVDLDDTVDADNDGTADNDFTALGVDENAAGIGALIKSDAFSGAAMLTFSDDDTGTTDTDEAYETAGTYNGASGTYRCNGTSDCTVTLNAMGKITAVSAGWIFTPDSDAMSPQPDHDYLHYGIWLKKTTDKDGVVTYNEVEAFHGASVNGDTEGSTGGGDLNEVVGSASYSGGATGVYVKNVYAMDGTIASATSGHFTANVALKAYFRGSSIAADMHDTVTGTIDGFMLSEDGANDDWSIALKGDRGAGANTFSGMVNTDGDKMNDDGSFNGMYHGATPIDPDGGGSARVAPGSVTGEFNASFSDGSVLGGFGARQPEEE